MGRTPIRSDARMGLRADDGHRQIPDWLFEDDLSTFRLRRRTPGSFLLIPSDREGRFIRCQSQLEARAVRVLVACPCVTAVKEQPLQVWYESMADGDFRLLTKSPQECRHSSITRSASRSYVAPDILVRMRDGRLVLIEVKPTDKLAKPAVARKCLISERFALANGWQFRVLTDRELKVEPLTSNVQLVGRHKRFVGPPTALDRIASCTELSGSTTESISSLAALTTTTVWHGALTLVWQHQLSCDLISQLLNRDVVLYPPGVMLWDPFASAWEPNGSSTGGPGVSSAN